MLDIKTIIRENDQALGGAGGPIRFYFRDPLAKALMVFYRLHYNIGAEELVALVAEADDYDMTEGEDIGAIIINFVTTLFPSMAPLEVFTGTPAIGQTYVAICELNPQLFDYTNEYTDLEGNHVKTTHVSSLTSGPVTSVGLYSEEYGFRFLGSTVASAGIEDVVTYILIHQSEGT